MSLISSDSVVPSKRDTTDTGPMAISLELPMKAYTRGVTKLVSAQSERKPSHETEELRCPSYILKTKPRHSHSAYWGSKFASFAYAMSCHACIHVLKKTIT